MIKFAVSVFKNEEAIRSELWDYEAGFETEFFIRIIGTLLDDQSLTLMINQTLFVELTNLGGGKCIVEYNVDSEHTSQQLTLAEDLPRANQDGFKLLSESFKGFISNIRNARIN
ncbi:hypothetical protein OTK49_03470 [Vibrio coralliirubri]|uniref:hypothetical protein n=1 Tax=Vibrio coralliirubri TaxID=1516159 RepID=UPI002284C45C|nr:hypothetical protein [Vibrio coralliirubri]MCY9861577.1 hypothetical protein [Vibrio coralliirubri]